MKNNGKIIKIKNKKINIDLVPTIQKNILDLHNLTIDETRAHIDQEIEVNYKLNIDKKVFVLLHGYSNGEVLQKYIRFEYVNKKIKYKEWGQNPGITYFILEENTKDGRRKK